MATQSTNLVLELGDRYGEAFQDTAEACQTLEILCLYEGVCACVCVYLSVCDETKI